MQLGYMCGTLYRNRPGSAVVAAGWRLSNVLFARLGGIVGENFRGRMHQDALGDDCIHYACARPITA